MESGEFRERELVCLLRQGCCGGVAFIFDESVVNTLVVVCVVICFVVCFVVLCCSSCQHMFL